MSESEMLKARCAKTGEFRRIQTRHGISNITNHNKNIKARRM